MNTTNREKDALLSEEEEVVLKVFNYFKANCTSLEAVRQTYLATGVPMKTIYSIRAKQDDTLVNQSNQSEAVQESSLTRVSCTSAHYAIRDIVHNLFIDNIAPTLKNVLEKTHSDPKLRNYTSEGILNKLSTIGFSFESKGNETVLFEMDKVITSRHQYLRKIRKYREMGKPIVYASRTWVNIEHLGYKCSNVETPGNAQPRVTLVLSGREPSFVTGAELKFLCKNSNKTNDISLNTFEKWFIEVLLPNLTQSSVIVLDSSPCNLGKTKLIPTVAWRKIDLIKWLKDESISTTDEMLKLELMDLIKSRSEKYKRYKLDHNAAKCNHVILRIPPHHENLNPLRMTWIDLENFIKMNSKSCNLTEIENIIQKAYIRITQEKWMTYVRQTIEIEQKMWDVDHIQDESVGSRADSSEVASAISE